MTALAVIGHNGPPEPTPFEAAAATIETLRVEAQNWLDGEPITTQGQADAVSKLLDDARKAKAKADAARVEEKRPHDDAGKAVQAKYKPLLDQADTVAVLAKRVLEPFLMAQEAAKREAERVAREAAAKAYAEAQAARDAARATTDLDAAEAAERAAAEAKAATIAAKAAAADKGAARGGARAVTLRTVRTAEVVDLTALMRWVWTHDQGALSGWAETYAHNAVRAGKTPDGVAITETQVAQ